MMESQAPSSSANHELPIADPVGRQSVGGFAGAGQKGGWLIAMGDAALSAAYDIGRD